MTKSQSQQSKLSLEIDPTKATPSMRSSLTMIRDCLLCPLCNNVMNQPSTLPQCSHSFCKDCISDYTRNSWICPFPACQLPVSNRGQSKSYMTINPQISTVISSLSNIITSLNSFSTNEWWKHLSKDSQDIIIGNNNSNNVNDSNDDDDDDDYIISKDNNTNQICIDEESFVRKNNKRRNIKELLKNDDDDDTVDNETIDNLTTVSQIDNDNNNFRNNRYTKSKKIRLNDTVEHIPFYDSTTCNTTPTTNQNNNDKDEEKELEDQTQEQLDDDNDLDDDETQPYSIDESTQPFSYIEKEDGGENNNDDTYKNKKEDDEDDNDLKQSQELIEFNNDDVDVGKNNDCNEKEIESFVANTPPPSSFAISHTTSRTTTKDGKNTLTPMNTSCIIPKNHSPKLSPIAFMESQTSIPSNNRKSTISTTYKTSCPQQQKQAVSFMALFQLLLNRIDNASNEEQVKCNNGLLDGYCLYVGFDWDYNKNNDYDDGCASNLIMNDTFNREHDNHQIIIDSKSFTKGRICLLLKLCGAEVKDLEEESTIALTGSMSTPSSQQDRTLIIVHNSNDSSFSKSKNVKVIPVVSSQWVFDSIHDFEVKDQKKYYVGEK